MERYSPTIGLEIHAELKTQTKMFCCSKNDPDETRPNVNICPVCMGHPGTLPTINKEAVKHVLKVGIAVGGKLADYSEFDRKNYFYPDIPKGYQISQYAYPLVKGGTLSGVSLTRVHLEEDTARSSHDVGEYSLVDFNRAGLPLMELVTDPCIHSSKQAADFARELQLLLRYLGVAHANMEKGEMRVEANISVSSDPKKFGTKVEVKNLNSFKSVERAIEFEIKRHISLLEKGEKVVQETRGWDENKGITFSQRQKEDSHDYRYFPDPDIPKIVVSEIPDFAEKILTSSLPELPNAKRDRYKTLGLKAEDAEVYVVDTELGVFFDAVAAILSKSDAVQLASNYIVSDLLGILKGSSASAFRAITLEPRAFAELIAMVGKGAVSSRAAKDILKIMHEKGGKPAEIAKSEGLLQQSDEGALRALIAEVVASNQKAVDEYKSGKAASLQFLVGQGMKRSKGAANPEVLKKLIVEMLG